MFLEMIFYKVHLKKYINLILWKEKINYFVSEVKIILILKPKIWKIYPFILYWK